MNEVNYGKQRSLSLPQASVLNQMSIFDLAFRKVRVRHIPAPTDQKSIYLLQMRERERELKHSISLTMLAGNGARNAENRVFHY